MMETEVVTQLQSGAQKMNEMLRKTRDAEKRAGTVKRLKEQEQEARVPQLAVAEIGSQTEAMAASSEGVDAGELRSMHSSQARSA